MFAPKFRNSISSSLLCLLILGLNAANGAESKIKFNPDFPQPTITDARLAESISLLDKMADKVIAENSLPGVAIAIVHKDKVVFAKGYGVREMGKNEKIDADTVFQLASVSKPLASTVVAAVVGEGKVSWDSKISDLDPDFALFDVLASSQVTIRDFLAHRSGLPEHAGDIAEDLGFDRAEVLHRLRFQKPESSIRSKYDYTNFGYTEGALAAAKAVKMRWEDLAQDRLFKPLGMNSSSYKYSDFVARANRAPGHVLVDGKWVTKYKRDPDAQAPAGGASSSVNDMTRWMRMQISDGKLDGKQIIAESAIKETHTPQIFVHFSPLNGLPVFYGLGFNADYDKSGRLNLSHSGAFSRGVATSIRLIPSEELGICVLTNAYPIGMAEALSTTFTDYAVNGKSTQNWVELFKQIFADPATLGITEGIDYSVIRASVLPAMKNSAYVGTYSNDFFGPLQIIEQNGTLALIVGPEKRTYSMKHFDRDVFTYQADTENLSGLSGVSFTVAANGVADRVVIENLDVRGMGVFTRTNP